MSKSAAGIGRARLHAFDGMRGILAIWIALFHAYPTIAGAFGWTDQQGAWWIAYGGFRTDLFFVLSGFTIGYVYERSWSGTLRGHLHFIRRRFSLLFVPHAVVMVCFALVVFALPGFTDGYSARKFTADAWVAGLFLIQNWFHWDPLSWNGPTWNISALWAGYVFVVPVLMTARRWRLGPGLLGFLVVTPLLVLIAFFWMRNASTFSVQALGGNLRMVAGLTSGYFLFRLMGAVRLSPHQADAVGVTGLCVAIVTMYRHELILLSLLAGPLLVAACTGQGRMARAVAWKPFLVIGSFSYSLYLCHYPVIQVTNWYLLHWPATTPAAGSAVILCMTLGILACTLLLQPLTHQRRAMPARQDPVLAKAN